MMNFLKSFWSFLTILWDFGRGFWALRGIRGAVTFFGSARFTEKSPYYAQAQALSQAIAKAGFPVITGAGPGMMEAVNRGAKDLPAEFKGKSYGFGIHLPQEQLPNDYLDRHIDFKHLFTRKFFLHRRVKGFVVLPGGIGTLDELSETLTLILAEKIQKVPVIFINSEYWQGFFSWLQNTLIPQGAISQKELDFIHCCDNPQEAVELLKQKKS